MGRATTSLKFNILIAPLDWGLGHATRCIPIINTLIQKDCNVFIACEGKIKALLHKEFPHLAFVHLKGYNITYSKNKWTLPLQIGKQIPKILSTIQYENERLKEIVKEHHIHGIISDNRYGFYDPAVPSIFVTHQLRIITPFGKIVDSYLQKLNYRYINKFSQCWIPDNESSFSLAGELSHPAKKLAIAVKYIGILSRFKEATADQQQHVLIILSGPEPQRTVLENLLVSQLIDYKGPSMLVRGLPTESRALNLPSHISVYNHLNAGALNEKINKASVVISRCGYSTIMDLAVLKKKSILIPTPGQTEQEYLAEHLMKKNFALCIDQKKFRLKNALALSEHFKYQIEMFSTQNNLNRTVDDFISLLKPL